MNRRQFLTHSTVGLSAIPFAACSTKLLRGETVGSPVVKNIIPEFQLQVPALMSELRVAGVSIALIQDAKVVWLGSFGYRDADTKLPVDKNTVFQAASMSKPVFAYAVLKLCEAHVIDLDTPLTQYTRDRFLANDPRLESITPRHVLSHSSGFQDWRSSDDPLKIHFNPGSEYLYSGEGYYYLQSVVTHLIGHTDTTDCARFEAGLEVCASDIDQFLIKHVLAPFGMRLSGYATTSKLRRHLATGHDGQGKPFRKTTSKVSERPAITRYASSGALLTTSNDYAKFVLEILNPKASDAFHLTQDTLNEMLRPKIKVAYHGFSSSWGLGWQIQDNGLFNHGGDNQGFHCHAIASRTSKSGFVIMTNSESGALLIQRLFGSGILKRFFPQNN
jgi:CubicO group peptidase (beta-lactamase class C family)